MNIRVKLNQPIENKTKGFYLLITNGDTFSNEKDIFKIDKKLIKVLEKNNIDFDIME